MDNVHIELLRKMLALSREQEASVREGRLAAALDIMKRRDALAAEMREKGVTIAGHDAEAIKTAAEIAESDTRIRMLTEERLKDVSDKLKARLNAKSVISAYMESE